MTKDKLIELAQVGMEIHSPNQPEYIVCEALIKALAQPEQEPFCYHDGRNIVSKDYADHSDVFPLYTTPPQRNPLTDEEIEDLYFDKFSMGELKSFARAIEAAHNIK